MTEIARQSATKPAVSLARSLPRLGFAGVGWIGRSRLGVLAESLSAEIVAVADPDETCVQACREIVPAVRAVDSLDELLDQGLDAIVIATPSALHAEQSIAAFNRGLAVFCQKPLGRSAAEVRGVVEAARRADRLLGVDLSYRWTHAASLARHAVQSDRIGRVFHSDLVFHNAYGPGKPWFYDLRLSGGGCVIDLGVHLVDLALWTLGFPQIVETRSRLYNKGILLKRNSATVEDFATVQLLTEDRADISLQCSWNLHAGCDAVIAARFYGERGSVLIENVNGSFYDFRASLCTGTKSLALAEPPDSWPGRAAVEWVRRLHKNPRFDPEAQEHVTVAEILDEIYGRADRPGGTDHVETSVGNNDRS
ncbi:MAG: Gfo/Idh/MocA family protein [Solirubrobacterales bacterium]